MFHAIGDSHIDIFPAFVKKHCVRDTTAYKVGIRENTWNDIHDYVKTLGKESDILILSFGELDCRFQLYFQSKKQDKPVSQLIESTVKGYIGTMQRLRALGFQVYVYGIPPPGWQETAYKEPWFATPEIHVQIYREFNEILRRYCAENKFKFLDIYPRTVGSDGHMLPAFIQRDLVHFNESVQPLLIELGVTP